MKRHLPLRPLAALLLVGCGQTSGGGTGQAPPTAVVVDPAEFLGAVSCSEAPGGMRRYVATLVDVTPFPALAADAGFVLPSSAPTDCVTAVHFLRIAFRREYVADIDGYDREDIEPLAPGSRVQVELGTAGGPEPRYVAPRWTTSCGREIPPAPPATDGGDAGDAGDAGDGSNLGDAGTEAAAQPPELDAGAEAGEPSTLCRVRAYDGGRPVSPWPACSEPASLVTVRGCGPLRDHAAQSDAGP